VPPEPADATFLFALDPPSKNDCQTVSYIGDVAIGQEFGYLATAAWFPPCNNGGNSSQQLMSTVFQFSKTGGMEPAVVGAAGETSEGSSKPRVATTGNDAIWVFSASGDNMVHVQSNAQISGLFATNGGNSPVAVVANGQTTFAGMWSAPPRNVYANHPRFPCCGGGNQPPPQYGFFQFTNQENGTSTAMPVTPAFHGEQVKRPLVATPAALYFIEHQAPAGDRVAALATGGSVADTIATLTDPPVALAADELHVAWATAVDFTTFSDQHGSGSSTELPNACQIFVTTAAAPHDVVKLLGTTQFSCLDVELDGRYLYFTIVRFGMFYDPFLVGEGLGRLDLDTMQLETLALGITDPEAGPRHIYLDGDGIIAVAPLIVARYRKAALDGRHDIAP
jgi:hypothetical protein